ncbi:hypothetical protein EIL87_18165 [Saccharopolyspora rhizosphaerae]|uniref:LppX_LprAFG lipoprotein n=1 Tax=Saccharopolyspora rhizosphaerae TaxID=2492662 RepID=A0A3R8P2T4_9PSEU|nr:hypothetical protein [Saccharopolyspora rhizosphaerae]RRO15186.1 hypothetical protein EIL87_18165 [Saccharopolyspora rhizosphaerae]
MPRARTRTALLSAGLALTATLGACTSEPQPPAAATKPAARPDPRPAAEPMLTDTLAKINRTGTAHTTMTGSLGVVGQLTADGAVRYRGPQADLVLDGKTRNTRTERLAVSIVDDVGYLNTPLARPDANKPWLRISDDGADFGSKLLSPALDQLHESVDPRATFSGVEQATRIQSSAPDTVDGRPTTRYELRILTDKAAEIAPDEEQRKRFQRAAANGQRELGYELWLDEQGLPAKFAATTEVAQAGEVSLTSTYRDWGAPVDIALPPEHEVGVFEDLPPMAQPPR